MLLDQHERGENLLKLGCQFRILFCVVRDRRPLAAPVSLDKFLGQAINRMPFGLQRAHGLLSLKPGMLSSMSFKRTRARPYRWLAASSRKPRTWAVSEFVSCSKCRSAKISRSIGFIVSRAA